jgi:hypothetical protein
MIIYFVMMLRFLWFLVMKIKIQNPSKPTEIKRLQK